MIAAPAVVFEFFFEIVVEVIVVRLEGGAERQWDGRRPGGGAYTVAQVRRRLRRLVEERERHAGRAQIDELLVVLATREQVLVHAVHLARLERVQDVAGDEVADLLAGHRGTSVRRAAPRRVIARRRRLFAVPSGMPSRSEVSRSVSESK